MDYKNGVMGASEFLSVSPTNRVSPIVTIANYTNKPNSV